MLVKLSRFKSMSKLYKPRLRNFENSSGQRHITDQDRYLYKKKNHKPQFFLNIIGTGTMGQEHMFVATLLGEAAVHGIFDQEVHSLDIAEEEFSSYANHSLVRYKDLKSACNDTQVDALLICTPNYTHYEVLKVAADSGKPIFLEKPMATTIEDAAEIYRIATGYSSFIQIGLQYRYKAQYVEAYHEVLNRKIIGDIQTITISEYRPPFLDKVDQWNKFSKYSGGTLVEKCCHYFDLMNLFADSIPDKVYAIGGKAFNFLDFKKNEKSADIDDHAFVLIEYKNGIRSSFTLNMFSPDFNEEMVVCGQKGRMKASETFSFKMQDSAEAKVSIELGELGSSRQSRISYPRVIEQSGHHGATFYEHIEFINKLKGRESKCATPLEGLWSIIIAGAAQQSIKKNRQIMMTDFLDEKNLSWLLDQPA